MTPRSRKPVLLISGTNIANLPNLDKPSIMDSLEEEPDSESSSKNSEDSRGRHSLTTTFREYLCSRSMLTASPADLSFSSRTDDYKSAEINDMSASKLSGSLLYCLDGNDPDCEEDEEKEPVLKPKQFDENGQPTVYETSF